MLTRDVLADPIDGLVHQPVLDVRGTDTLRRAATQLAANHIGLLVVRRGGLVVGVLSERDLVRAAGEGLDIDATRVDEVMTEDIAGIRDGATVRDALTVMADNGVRHLLVRRDGQVLGVISARDVLVALRAMV